MIFLFHPMNNNATKIFKLRQPNDQSQNMLLLFFSGGEKGGGKGLPKKFWRCPPGEYGSIFCG